MKRLRWKGTSFSPNPTEKFIVSKHVLSRWKIEISEALLWCFLAAGDLEKKSITFDFIIKRNYKFSLLTSWMIPTGQQGSWDLPAFTQMSLFTLSPSCYVTITAASGTASEIPTERCCATPALVCTCSFGFPRASICTTHASCEREVRLRKILSWLYRPGGDGLQYP